MLLCIISVQHVIYFQEPVYYSGQSVTVASFFTVVSLFKWSVCDGCQSVGGGQSVMGSGCNSGGRGHSETIANLLQESVCDRGQSVAEVTPPIQKSIRD